MQLSQSKVSYPVDLWVRDDQGNVILVVDVKFAAHSENYVSQLEAYLRATSEHDRRTIPYAMLITRDFIRVYQWDGNVFSEPTAELVTADVLSMYDADFNKKRIFEFYAETLIEGWLRDFAFHWKHPHPPGEDHLKDIGLFDKLQGALTTSVKEATSFFDEQ
jgi:hypothetical protein